MLTKFAGVAVVLVWGILFPAILLGLSKLFHPNNPTPTKLSTYECGLETQGETWVQFKISYFMYALIFVVFDVETVFLYPWAMKFQSMLAIPGVGTFVFAEMFIFIAILLVGFWYAWKEGALEWM